MKSAGDGEENKTSSSLEVQETLRHSRIGTAPCVNLSWATIYGHYCSLFSALWWILLNYWPLWGRDGFASVLQIAGHHCDIQVKSTWHTEQVLTDYESECKASRLIIICRISGWGVLIGSKYYVTKETNSKSITCNVIDPQAITKMMSL